MSSQFYRHHGSTQKLCFNCNQPGHLAVACPMPRSMLHRICGGCRQKGHTADHCPNRADWVCKNCAEHGHGHWECSQPKEHPDLACHLCNGVGHTAKSCYTRISTGRRRNGNQRNPGVACGACGEPGHLKAQCSQRPCLDCGGVGYHASFCSVIWHFSEAQYHSAAGVNVQATAHETTTPQALEAHSQPLGLEASSNYCKPRGSACADCVSQVHSGVCPIVTDYAKPACHTSGVHSYQHHPHGSESVLAVVEKSQPQADGTPASESSTISPLENSLFGHAVTLGVKKLREQANVRLQAGEPDEAIAFLTQAIELDPSDAESYIARGRVNAQNKQHSAALADFDSASAPDKRGYGPSPDLFLQIARSRFLIGSSFDALRAVRDALALDRTDDAALLHDRILAVQGHTVIYERAVAWGHWHMARSAYEACLAVYAQEDSDAPPLVRCWGVALLVVDGAWEEATKSVNILLRDVPGDVYAMNLRAQILFLQGQLPEAIEQVLAVIKLDPENERAKTFYTRFKEVSQLKDSGSDLYRKNLLDDALSSWNAALELVDAREDEGRGGILRAKLLLNRAIIY